MLVLNSEDLELLADCNNLIETVAKAMVSAIKGKFTMPLRTHVEHDGNTLLLMPCFGGNRFSTKIVSIFPENRSIDAPVIEGMVVLNNGYNGSVEAVMNGAALTAWRTGAVGGAGVSFTTPMKPLDVGLIGAGVQGFYQLLFSSSVRQLKSINIYDGYKKSLKDFVKRVQQNIPGIPVKVESSQEALVSSSDLIICATNSQTPVIPDSRDLVRGKSFIGIGSYKPDMREFPEAVFRELGNCYVDTLHGIEETGDLITPLKNGWIRKEQIKSLGELVNRREVDGDGTTLFKSVGMALLDLKVAETFYLEAIKTEVGTKIQF